MTNLSSRELKRHQHFASALLVIALMLWAIGAWCRAADRWIPEYAHALIGLAAVALFTSLTWRLLAFAQTLWNTGKHAGLTSSIVKYLIGYSLCILAGAIWLIYEQRQLPDIAWMAEQSASWIVFAAFLAILFPWTLILGALSIFGTEH